ncbi:hypothetical protein HUW51_20015 [Adhaeribacter swui]|uniref:DUF8201 domain-containing protein n=1 Tax=Adhaeribacter swui TaxID=2086471 RepID=A0A7G7GCL2_9BACT|nr:hypothetical protein [Adhaeribacter swui]QNF34896.1 hypothetical protein HUW51_20015 [Adhaeribacter swui]
MLATLLIWFYIAFITFTYGVLWFRLLAKAGYLTREAQVPIEVVLVAGSGVLSVILGILHLCLPVAITLHVFILAGSFVILWFWKNSLRWFWQPLKISGGYNKLYSGILFLLAILVLMHAAQPVINPDTGLYHAQTIQWFSKYRIVPGLGNLYGPLALNSHAHLLMSFFNFWFFSAKVFNQTWVSFIFLLYCSYALRQGFIFLKSKPGYAVYYFGSLFWGLVFFRDWISSPTPDTAVMFFFFFLFGVLLSFNNKELGWEVAFLFFLLPVLLTFKLSAVYGGIIGVVWLIILKKTVPVEWVKLLIGQGLLVLIPYCLRNVILTGHLFYPVMGLDLFHLDWAVPENWINSYQEGISAYSRAPVANWSFYQNKSFMQWVPVWWEQQNRPDKLFSIILMLLLPVMIWQFFKNYKQKRNHELTALWLSAFLASLAWFYTAPAFRFGYGYLVPTLLLGILLLVRNKITYQVSLCMGLLMGLYGINGIYKQIARQNFSVFWPADYPIPVTEVKQINNTAIHVAPGIGRCWSLLPCTVPEWEPNLEMRGPTVEEGFRRKID